MESATYTQCLKACCSALKILISSKLIAGKISYILVHSCKRELNYKFVLKSILE